MCTIYAWCTRFVLFELNICRPNVSAAESSWIHKNSEFTFIVMWYRGCIIESNKLLSYQNCIRRTYLD